MHNIEADPISMLDGSCIIKNLEAYSRFNEIKNIDEIQNTIMQMTAAQVTLSRTGVPVLEEYLADKGK